MQTMWSYTTIACGRPAADYSLSIICRPLSEPTGERYQPYIVDEATDFMTFEKCCPRDNGVNQYINQRDCSQYCYTDDTKLAGAFSQCINDTAKVAIESAHKAGKLNDTSRPGQYWGRCEYIDYKRLKQGIRDSGASQHHDGMIKTLISALGVGLFLVGSGLV